MSPQIIGVKQLYKELKKISEAALHGQSFVVVKNSKPVFRIEPIEKTAAGKYSLQDFKKLQFKTSNRNLSKLVDKIAYGA